MFKSIQLIDGNAKCSVHHGQESLPAWVYKVLSQVPYGKEILQKIYSIYHNPALATAGPIIAINLAVFLAWRCVPFSPILNSYFLHTASSRVSSLLLSCFSHSGVWCNAMPRLCFCCGEIKGNPVLQGFHLIANMYVLWSFSAVGQTIVTLYSTKCTKYCTVNFQSELQRSTCSARA